MQSFYIDFMNIMNKMECGFSLWGPHLVTVQSFVRWSKTNKSTEKLCTQINNGIVFCFQCFYSVYIFVYAVNSHHIKQKEGFTELYCIGLQAKRRKRQ